MWEKWVVWVEKYNTCSVPLGAGLATPPAVSTRAKGGGSGGAEAPAAFAALCLATSAAAELNALISKKE